MDKILDGMIVLYIVCKNGNVEFCKYCLLIDLDILNLEDINGWNVFYFVVFYGYRFVLIFLRYKYRNLRIWLDIFFENIFYLVCLSGNKDFYLYIWKIYLDIICDEDREGRIIEYYVVWGGNIEILKDLL